MLVVAAVAVAAVVAASALLLVLLLLMLLLAVLLVVLLLLLLLLLLLRVSITPADLDTENASDGDDNEDALAAVLAPASLTAWRTLAVLLLDVAAVV